MTNETDTDPSSPRNLLERSLQGSTMLLEGADWAPADDVDLIDALFTVAWFNQYQLGVLVSLVSSVQSGTTTVDDVLDIAQQFDVASASSIGAAATLLSLMREGDEEAIGRFLASSLQTFDDSELRDGASALAAALTSAVAMTLGLDRLTVLAEMVNASLGHPGDARDASTNAPVVRRHVPIVSRRTKPRRPTLRRCFDTPVGVAVG